MLRIIYKSIKYEYSFDIKVNQVRETFTPQRSIQKSTQNHLGRFLNSSKPDKIELSFTKSDIRETDEPKSHLTEILKFYLPESFNEKAIELLIQKIPESVSDFKLNCIYNW